MLAFANLFLAAFSFIISFWIVRGKDAKEKKYWEFLQFIIFLVLLLEIASLAKLFGFFYLPGGGRELELLLVGSIVYVVLIEQNRWKIEKTLNIER